MTRTVPSGRCGRGWNLNWRERLPRMLPQLASAHGVYWRTASVLESGGLLRGRASVAAGRPDIAAVHGTDPPAVCGTCVVRSRAPRGGRTGSRQTQGGRAHVSTGVCIRGGHSHPVPIPVKSRFPLCNLMVTTLGRPLAATSIAGSDGRLISAWAGRPHANQTTPRKTADRNHSHFRTVRLLRTEPDRL
jgi:hypothetical protein